MSENYKSINQIMDELEYVFEGREILPNDKYTSDRMKRNLFKNKILNKAKERENVEN